MNHPWGVSGPAFLWLYGGALVLATAVALGLRYRVRRPAATEPPEPTVPVMAFLAGGAVRVVEASIARLIELGAVRPARGGTVTAVPFAVADPLDRAVHERLGTTPQWLASVRLRLTDLPEVRHVADFLAARGLVLRAGTTARVRYGTAAPLAVLVVVGMARVGTGLAGGYPVGYLVLELFATVILLAVFLSVPIKPRTVSGEEAFEYYFGKLGGAGHQAALGGLFAYPDGAVRLALMPPPPPPMVMRRRGGRIGGAGHAGGFSCSSGGSSCGGGGGGCGGGGGGGGG